MLHNSDKIFSKKLFRLAYVFLIILLVIPAAAGTVRKLTAATLPKLAVDDTRIASDDVLLKRYIKDYGAEQAIAFIKTLPTDCHQRVHKVGNLSYELNKNKAFTVLNSECMSGYTHGVTTSYFREHGTENLNENLELICQGQQNGFYAHQCYHGIGHGLMAYSDYDLPAALKSCDVLPPSGIAKESCYSGVFMENVVGATTVAAAKASAKPGNFHVSSWLSDDPLFPCNAKELESKYKNACYSFQSSRMIQVLNYDYEKVSAVCSNIEDVYHYTCFSSMGRDVSNTYQNDYAKIEKACSYTAVDSLRLSCINGASQDKFWHESEQDKALGMCRAMQKADAKNNCYITLNARATEIIPTKEGSKAFCAKYEPEYTQICRIKQ